MKSERKRVLGSATKAMQLVHTVALGIFAVIWIILLISVITTTNDAPSNDVKPIELENNLRVGVATTDYHKMDSLG